MSPQSPSSGLTPRLDPLVYRVASGTAAPQTTATAGAGHGNPGFNAGQSNLAVEESYDDVYYAGQAESAPQSTPVDQDRPVLSRHEPQAQRVAQPGRKIEGAIRQAMNSAVTQEARRAAVAQLKASFLQRGEKISKQHELQLQEYIAEGTSSREPSSSSDHWSDDAESAEGWESDKPVVEESDVSVIFHFDDPVPATETVEQKHANEQRYREEERALTQEAQVPTFEGMVAFIDSLGTTGLTREQLSAMALPTFDPASFSDQAWGIIKAGATAYGTSFMVGKILINYLALAGKEAGLAGWGAFPLAGVLNEIVSAPLAGAIRANHGTYGSPDGTASANYHTANASLLAARISGNQTEIEKCRNNLDSVVKSAIANAKTRAGDGDKTLWAQWDAHPIVSASIRSWLTDDLPFVSFIAMYLAPGGTAAMMSADLDNKAAFAALDGLAFAASGATAGILTVLGQNLGRKLLQHAPQPRQGTETEAVRDRHVVQADQTMREIDKNVEQLQEHLKSVEQLIKGGDNRPLLKELQARLAHMISVLSLKELSEEDRMRALQSGVGRTGLGAKAAFRGNVFGEPINPPATAFLDGAPMQRRTAANALGNAAALAAIATYMACHVLPLAAQAVGATEPDDDAGFNATGFNATGFNSTNFTDFTDLNTTFAGAAGGESFNSSLYGMTNALVLIGGWACRRALATGAEYALAVGEGLRRRRFDKKQEDPEPKPEDAGHLLP